MDPTLAGLCDRLASHLIRPESFLAIPWYWFQRVLPELGDDLGVLYLMCKNCCYVDWARGKDRNTFWVPGGLPTLQGWRSATLPNHFLASQANAVARSTEKQPRFRPTPAVAAGNRDSPASTSAGWTARSSDNGIDWHCRFLMFNLTALTVLKQAFYAFLFALRPGSARMLSDYASVRAMAAPYVAKRS